MRSGSRGIGRVAFTMRNHRREVRNLRRCEPRSRRQRRGRPIGLLVAVLSPRSPPPARPTRSSRRSRPGGTSRRHWGPPAPPSSIPPRGPTDVPVNLAAVVLRFPAPVLWGADRRCGSAMAQPRAVRRPAEERCDGGVCYRAPLAGASGGRRLPGRLGAGNEDGAGTALPREWSGSSTRRRSRQRAARALGGHGGTPPGPCLAVTLLDRRAGGRRVVVTAAGVEVASAAGRGPDQLRRRRAALAGLPPSSSATVVVQRRPIARATSPPRRRCRFKPRRAARPSRSPRCSPTPPGRSPPRNTSSCATSAKRAVSLAGLASRTARAATISRRRCSPPAATRWS